MTTAVRSSRARKTASVAEATGRVLPQRHFSVDEYYRMAEAGILLDGERVELLDGVIVEMAPIGNRHAACVATLSDWFSSKLKKNALVWAQNPVRLSDRTEPQPDVAIVRRRPDRYTSS